jgi:ABC-type oligopeptide transport system ATPase subunit
MSDVAISIKNLSKTYPVPLKRLRELFRRPPKNPVEALRDVSFEVQTGEIFSLWVFGRAVRRAKREGSLIQY